MPLQTTFIISKATHSSKNTNTNTKEQGDETFSPMPDSIADYTFHHASMALENGWQRDDRSILGLPIGISG
ncbi:MAG: hypothetical protein ACTH5B_18250 [Marinomonas sp.]|uniref:hypothetical protein n=1 Tax=Marinomonas sp. TaxID=1904862 RepID=UPI003F9E2B20